MTAPYIPPRPRTLEEALRAAFMPPIQADATATPPVRPDFSGVPMATMRATSAPMPRGPRESGNPAADRLNARVDRGLAMLGRAAAPSADTPEGWLREMFNPVAAGRGTREMANATGAQMRRAGRTGNVGDAAMAAGLGGLTLASAIPGGPADDAVRAGRRMIEVDGVPQKLYHQTLRKNVASIERDGFDLSRVGARASDEQVPDGVFMKPTDADIGIASSDPDEIAQMPVFASIRNPLVVQDRDEMARVLSGVPEYQEALAEVKRFDDAAGEIEARWMEESNRLERGPERRALVKEAQEQLAALKPGEQAAAARARAVLTKHLRDSGYDGVVIHKDDGPIPGRFTPTVIALDPKQVRTNLAPTPEASAIRNALVPKPERP